MEVYIHEIVLMKLVSSDFGGPIRLETSSQQYNYGFGDPSFNIGILLVHVCVTNNVG